MRHLVLLFLFLFASAASAADGGAEVGTRQVWRAVLFDGRKAGWSLTEREVRADGSVRTLESMDLDIQREGARVAMGSVEETLESASGEPLSFRAEIKTAGQTVRYTGRKVGKRKFEVAIESSGSQRKQTLDIPAHALFFEGQRKALVAGYDKPKALVVIDAFVPSQLAVVPVETQFKSRRRIELMSGEAQLMEIEQMVRYPDGAMAVTAYVDAQFDAQRIRMPLLGMQIELLACNEKCAKGPNQPLDFLGALIVPSPRALDSAELSRGLRFKLRIAQTDLSPANTSHQRVRATGKGRYDLDVATIAEDSDVVDALYRQPSAWVQSDNVLITDLAKRATAGAKGDLERMQKAEAFVRDYIFGKSLSVGYASALEVATTRQGDCTEHALLLTALARASGIPARVATGIAYVPHFSGRDHVFVPHAWTEAYVDGRWQGFDAALARFDTGHIALAVGDGDPVRYFAGVALLGHLRIDAVEAIAD